ncbi:MAG: DUF4340 domain-containing protein [Gammaproteobacteria bacterium]
MKSRWVINLLLLVAIGLLSLISYQQSKQPETDTTQLTSLNPDSITEISLHRPTYADLVFSKQGKSWVILSDPLITADQGRIRSLLNIATQTTLREYSADSIDAGKLGFTESSSHIRLNNLTIIFGDIDALDGLRYVRTDKRMALIADDYQRALNADFTWFMNKRLIPVNRHILSLQLPGQTMSRSGGKWISIPSSTHSPEEIQAFIQSWEDSAALNIERYEPDTDTDQIILELDNPNEVIHLDIVSRENELILGRADYRVQYKLGNAYQTLLSISQ